MTLVWMRGGYSRRIRTWHVPVKNTMNEPPTGHLYMHLSQSATTYKDDRPASSKLWEDAIREEAEEAVSGRSASTSRILQQHVSQEENWTGEESMRDAVLRMLVDKYKPLRGPGIRTADDKLRQSPPTVSPGTPIAGPSTAAAEPLLPSVEGHKPWLVTFKAPSHAVSVKLGNISPIASGSSPGRGLGSVGGEEREKKVERSARRRSEEAQRLGRARESTLDYRMGIRRGEQMNAESQQRRPMPVNMKGWASLVEERIERARQEGHFKTIRGRGKPLIRETDEHNPFIAREEFLMNRIVQRNGAAPPWVELQTELESTISSFRTTLQASWTRRAIRMLSLSRPPSALAALTLSEITSLRDSEWEARERAYHDTAVEELNSLVRRYNGVAPYPVRKPYHDRNAELDRVYQESGEGIMRGLEERIQSMTTGNHLMGGGSSDEEDSNIGRGSGSDPGMTTSHTSKGLWRFIIGLFRTPEVGPRS